MGAKRARGLVVVESPAKAKKISEYLGAEYRVMATMGHLRDLPTNAAEIPTQVKKEPWASLGVDVEADFAPLYIVPGKKKKILKELREALKEADELIVATDEDREGESIGWHLTQLLKPAVPVRRMVFSEITREAIQAALETPRQLDGDLVAAQEARRILDRLYGYTLSPLLWKKVARGLSAGRVQSVAVRVLVQRELERMAFRSGRYWDLKAELETPDEARFEVELYAVGGVRAAQGKDFDESTGRLKQGAQVVLLDEESAGRLRLQVEGAEWKVSRIEERRQARRPNEPFITSTLQQEASRKLGMTARQTMMTAQRLYEDGHITYMRTDSVHLSDEAVRAARSFVRRRYGEEYLSTQARQFTNRVKGAQEAHEAIRPTGAEMKTGRELGLQGRELKLYELIWRRTAATQMAEARLHFQTVVVAAGEAEFRTTGRQVEFAGFFRAYVQGGDEGEAGGGDEEIDLPPLSRQQRLGCRQVEVLDHETKPPARYTEAALIRTLEAEGIGRPSTFATIVGTIQDRGYVRKAGNQLIPTFTAMVVTHLLERYFPALVDLRFTAKMEQMLDDVATGEVDYLPYLKKFYCGAEGLSRQVMEKEESIDPRQARQVELEGLGATVRVGRYGPYIQEECGGERITVSIPEELAPADLTLEMTEKLIAQKRQKPQALGLHPEEGIPVFVLNGPFGPYVQLGEADGDGKRPRKSVSIPKNIDPREISLDTAVRLLELPRTLGTHPESGKPVQAGIGRFGPYVVHNKNFKSLPPNEDVLGLDLARALELLRQTPSRSESIRELGKHPEDGETVSIYRGRYGPYVKHGKINAAIPRDRDLDQIRLEEALVWLEENAARKAGHRRRVRAER